MRFPVAGPPCFLDDDLFPFNDLDDDPANIFPNQPTFLAEMARGRGRPAGSCSCPAPSRPSRTTAAPSSSPTGDLAPDAIFGDERAYLERYRADWADWLAREKASWPRGRYDVVAELRAWFEPLLDLAPYTRRGVGGGGAARTSVTSAC